jgi:hypothetical protein
VVPKKPATEEEADRRPLEPWEVARLREALDTIERLKWAARAARGFVIGATAVLGLWMLLRTEIMEAIGRGVTP